LPGEYAASIIFLAQFVVIALRVTKKKLHTTTLQAMEFVYLGFGAVGVLTIVSLLSELDSERSLQAEAFANMRLARAEELLDRGQQSCRDNPPDVAEKVIVRRACEWLNKADAFFDGGKTERAWAKIKDEHSAILADGRRELMTTMLVDPISHKPTQYMFGYGFEMIGVWVGHYLDSMALSRRLKTDLANIHDLGTSWSNPNSEYSWQIQFLRLAAPFPHHLGFPQATLEGA
jgi:hypothetical protein